MTSELDQQAWDAQLVCVGVVWVCGCVGVCGRSEREAEARGMTHQGSTGYSLVWLPVPVAMAVARVGPLHTTATEWCTDDAQYKRAANNMEWDAINRQQSNAHTCTLW